jgi:hypothetical protein
MLRKHVPIALLGGALILGAGALAFGNPSAGPSGSAAPATQPAARHPELRRALREMREAREHLKNAAHDFGGHRVVAIKALDEAIRQVEQAATYEKPSRSN